VRVGGAERDVCSIYLPRWGRVVADDDDVVPFQVLGPDEQPVEPVARFLADFVARGNQPTSVRSYAYALLRWWRWLEAVRVGWDRATSAEVRDLVLWLAQARKPAMSAAPLNGAVNVVTGKPYPGSGYGPRTVRHSNAVLHTFYEYWIDRGEGPLVNPVQRAHSGAAPRPNRHHNPLEPFRPEGRLRYNPKIPKASPRAMPDQRWAELFGRLTSNRDRALLALAVSNGARASELLGLRGHDLDWGEQRIRLVRKGSRAVQWVPSSPESFVWIRLYLSELGEPLAPDQALWQTMRRRDRGAGLRRHPLSYDALRAVFRRVNAELGTNWSMHDLRHTAALRMARDPALTLRDVQVVLGHAHLSTTADIYLAEQDIEVARRVHQHLVEQASPSLSRPSLPPAAGEGYDRGDLSVLFGWNAG
jgi:integrase